MGDFKEYLTPSEAGRYTDKVVAWRRDIHRHPELSQHEERTSALVAEVLTGLSLEVRRNVGGHGVVALLRGKKPGKTVALRADMDALPLKEETGLPYASEVEGVMHACGHDTHTAMLLGVAWKILRPSMGELTDASLPEETETEIMDILRSGSGVTEPHNLRTRHIGNRVAIEAHIRMDGALSLNEAHERTSAIEKQLKDRFGPDTIVTLHMEPTK